MSTPTEQQVKTFYPTTPVDFSSSLIEQLDSTLETNYTRQQYSKIYIEKEVNKSLKKLEASQLSAFKDILDNNKAKDQSSATTELSVASLNEKLEGINKNLIELNKQMDKIHSKPADLVKAEKELNSCLISNKGKVLECWTEFNNFKKLSKEY